MAKPYYLRPEFMKLQREWDSRLEADGFEDIEDRDEATGMAMPLLRGVSQGDLCRRLYQPETEEYYRAARGHEHSIEDAIRRAVWHLHAEGMSVDRIFASVGRRYELRRNAVKRIVDQEKARMFARVNKELDRDDREEE